MSGSSKKGFLLPPAVGYSLSVISGLLLKSRVSLVFIPRLILTLLINLVNWPFRVYERIFINPKYLKSSIDEKPGEAPIFIIGHWRSGTTHLHNILCKDPQMGYTTTYQSVFPDTLFVKMGRFIFEGFARILIPGTRKGDNVTLGMTLPQEEEFALGDKTPVCFYYFWMFPRHIRTYYERSVRFKGLSVKTIESWRSDYRLLIKKALINTGKSRFLSKNPPNTGRVKFLLETYPNARFIHIHRNPVEVFLSTQNFFRKMMPHLQLQTVKDDDLSNDIFIIYKQIMQDYLEQRSLIPKGQLVEISYDELESQPEEGLDRIYKTLQIQGYDEALPLFRSYLKRMKSYRKNKHFITKELQERILKEWGFAMKEWNYLQPENIEIRHEK